MARVTRSSDVTTDCCAGRDVGWIPAERIIINLYVLGSPLAAIIVGVAVGRYRVGWGGGACGVELASTAGIDTGAGGNGTGRDTLMFGTLVVRYTADSSPLGTAMTVRAPGGTTAPGVD